jgi:hypothetical protein
MADKESEEYLERHKVLLEQQSQYLPVWQGIREFILPFTGMFDSDTPNDRPTSFDSILDGTATRASRVLGAGMQGGLTSPARPWFRLGLFDEDLANFRAVRVWLETVEKLMYARFAKSNFYNMIHRVYQEEGGYGQAVMIVDADPEEIVRFTVLTCGEYSLAESAKGVVDTMYRTVQMQSRQIEQKFGKSSIPDDLAKAMKDRPYEWHKVIHLIQPRKEFNPEKIDSINMPIESVYIYDGGDNSIIKKSGYKEQPMACPRWLTTGGDPYGRSPGWDCLGDVKMLQQMSADLYEGLEKVVRPPLKAAGSLKHEISHMAGMVSYSENASTSDSIKPIFEVRLDLTGLVGAIQDVRMQIREGFYNDMFLMLIEPKPNMTATEIAERHEEKLLMLGPVIERQFYELLDPVVGRTFTLMYDAGMLPPPPRALTEAIKSNKVNGDLRVSYISLLAQAQKLVTTQSIRAVSEYATGMSTFVPDIMDGFDHDKALSEFAGATGAPPEIIRTADIIKQIRVQKVKQMQEAKAQAQADAQAQTAKTMSETDTQTPNALTDLARSMSAEGQGAAQ